MWLLVKLGQMDTYLGEIQSYLRHMQSYSRQMKSLKGQIQSYWGHIMLHVGHIQSYFGKNPITLRTNLLKVRTNPDMYISRARVTLVSAKRCNKQTDQPNNWLTDQPPKAVKKKLNSKVLIRSWESLEKVLLNWTFLIAVYNQLTNTSKQPHKFKFFQISDVGLESQGKSGVRQYRASPDISIF